MLPKMCLFHLWYECTNKHGRENRKMSREENFLRVKTKFRKNNFYWGEVLSEEGLNMVSFQIRSRKVFDVPADSLMLWLWKQGEGYAMEEGNVSSPITQELFKEGEQASSNLCFTAHSICWLAETLSEKVQGYDIHWQGGSSSSASLAAADTQPTQSCSDVSGLNEGHTLIV